MGREAFALSDMGFRLFFAKKVLFTTQWMGQYYIVCVETRQSNTAVIRRELCVIGTSWQL